jgi:hypothetical protein
MRKGLTGLESYDKIKITRWLCTKGMYKSVGGSFGDKLSGYELMKIYDCIFRRKRTWENIKNAYLPGEN